MKPSKLFHTDFEYLVGSDFNQSKEELKDFDIILREHWKDGKYIQYERSYKSNRINVSTKDGIITEINDLS